MTSVWSLLSTQSGEIGKVSAKQSSLIDLQLISKTGTLVCQHGSFSFRKSTIFPHCICLAVHRYAMVDRKRQQELEFSEISTSPPNQRNLAAAKQVEAGISTPSDSPSFAAYCGSDSVFTNITSSCGTPVLFSNPEPSPSFS